MKTGAAVLAVSLILLYFMMKNARASSLSPADYLQLAPFNRFDPLFKFYASRYGITDWRWIKAIGGIESSYGEAPSVKRGLLFPTDVTGSASTDKKSWGVMQPTLPTANDMRAGVTISELNDPEINIEIGAKYFAWLLKRYSGQLDKAVKAYNQGPGNTDKGMKYADVYYAKWTSEFSTISKKQGP